MLFVECPLGGKDVYGVRVEDARGEFEESSDD